MSDGTPLNPGVGGDLISDEDLTGEPRLSPAVPQLSSAQAAYKLERTKVAVGPYGTDRGDVDLDGRPFPVEMGAERRLLEAHALLLLDEYRTRTVLRHSERQPAATFNARIGRMGRDGI